MDGPAAANPDHPLPSRPNLPQPLDQMLSQQDLPLPPSTRENATPATVPITPKLLGDEPVSLVQLYLGLAGI